MPKGINTLKCLSTMDDDASTYRAPASALPAFRYFSLPASPVAPPPNPLWLTQESCAFKATTGVVLGAGVGAMMGLFFGILGADPSVPVGPGGRAPAQPLGSWAHPRPPATTSRKHAAAYAAHH